MFAKSSAADLFPICGKGLTNESVIVYSIIDIVYRDITKFSLSGTCFPSRQQRIYCIWERVTSKFYLGIFFTKIFLLLFASIKLNEEMRA